jgi:DNA relaxase NicK
MIERAIDYLQASLLLSESTIIMKGFKPLPAIRFYKRGYQHPNGFRLYFGNPNSHKAVAIAAGDALQSLRNDGKMDAEILDWVLSAGGEVSRIDLAVTEFIEEELLTLEDVECWYKKGLIASALIDGGFKEISRIREDGGRERETLYIGDIKKRGKKGLFRAYDKGVELGLGSEIVTRIELELKREKAHNTAKRLVETNDIAGNFRASFDVKSKDFERLMDADAVIVHRGKNATKQEESEEIARRWDWLLKQVAPALKQAIKDERQAGRGDARLIAFMAESGILGDARQIADKLSLAKYRDMLERNELVPKRGKED